MKTKVLKSVKLTTLFLLLLTIGYSCSDDVVGLESRSLNISIKKADWRWDDDARKFYVVVNLPELTRYIYENGTLGSYVFIGQQGVDEVQNKLPYVHAYDGQDDDGNPIPYSEYISSSFKLGNPSTVYFFIQASDLLDDPEVLFDYNFRVVLQY